MIIIFFVTILLLSLMYSYLLCIYLRSRASTGDPSIKTLPKTFERIQPPDITDTLGYVYSIVERGDGKCQLWRTKTPFQRKLKEVYYHGANSWEADYQSKHGFMWMDNWDIAYKEYERNTVLTKL